MTEPVIAEMAEKVIAIAEQAQLTQEVITRTQAEIVLQQSHSRRIARRLAVSVAANILLTSFLIVLAVFQYGTSRAIHRSQLEGCAIGNQLRSGQLHLWDHILTISAPPPHETTRDRQLRLAQEAAFRAYVSQQFRLVDCARLYGS